MRRMLEVVAPALFEPMPESGLSMRFDQRCWACVDKFASGLFPPPETFPLTWEGRPEHALVAALHVSGEHIHTHYALGGFECDILMPFLNKILEHDGTYAHRDCLDLERRQNAAWERAGMSVFRVREAVLPRTGAIDLFLRRAFRPTPSSRLASVIVDYVLTGRAYGMGWPTINGSGSAS